MTASLAYTLAASGTGIVSALWFCLGSVFTTPKAIAEISMSRWDYHEAHADAIIAQSAQYSVGAPLLVIAFLLQVLAAIVDPACYLDVPVFMSSPLNFLLSIIFPVYALSFLLYRLILKIKGERVHTILKQTIEE
jgi:hypothetical protein